MKLQPFTFLPGTPVRAFVEDRELHAIVIGTELIEDVPHYRVSPTTSVSLTAPHLGDELVPMSGLIVRDENAFIYAGARLEEWLANVGLRLVHTPTGSRPEAS